jgi:hypothetical protein
MSDVVLRNDLERLLSEGQAAAKRGDKETARRLLTQLVEQDPQNEQAWMWLSGVVSDPEEQQICLENVLVINPNNVKARKGLEYLRAKSTTHEGSQPHSGQSSADARAQGTAAGETSVAEAGATTAPPAQSTSPLDGDPSVYQDPVAAIFPDWPSSSPSHMHHQGRFAPTGPIEDEPAVEPWMQAGAFDPADPLDPFAAPGTATTDNAYHRHPEQYDRYDQYDQIPQYQHQPPIPWAQPEQFNRSEIAEAAGAIIDSWESGGATAGGWSNQASANWQAGSDAWPVADSSDHAGGWEGVYPAPAPQVPDTPFAEYDAQHRDAGVVPVPESPPAHPYAPFAQEPVQGAGQEAYADEAFSDLEPFSFDMGAEAESNTSSLYQGQAEAIQQFPQPMQPAWAVDGPLMAQQPQGEPEFYGPQPEQGFPPVLSGMPGVEQAHHAQHVQHGQPTADALSHDPFAGMGVGPMGPYTANDLPTPADLPGYREPAGQPWYLQASEGAPAAPAYAAESYDDGSADGAAAAAAQQQPAKTVATINCPNCRESVPETALACPHCRYSFFVNCPHCHELVDTSEAKPNNPEPCPYCNTVIDKMALGMSGATGAIPYESVPLGQPVDTFPAMLSGTPEIRVRHGLSFGWLIDLLWLAAIIAMVWALTQLPVWLNLPGQY